MKHWSLNIASEEEIQRFKQRVTDLLEKKGIKLDHPGVVEKLLRAGATQDAHGYVHFPASMQADYLALAPREFLIAGMEPRFDVPIPHPVGGFYARGPIGQMFYLDPLTGEYRENTMEDQLDYIKVQQALEHISLWGNFTVKLDGFPAETMDVHTASLCFKHSQKPAYWMHYNANSVRYVTEMAQVIAGGSEQLSKRPFLTLQCCAATPMGINYMDCEQIVQAAALKLPLHCTSLPCSGANAPITPEGIALMSTAEVIAQAIIAQVLGAGTPVLLSAFTYSSDMRCFQTLISGTEQMLSRLLAVQVIQKGYQLPCHTFNGGTNSHTLDMQAIADDAMLTQVMALSGAVMMGDLGALETGMIASPLQLIIDNDLVQMAKRLQEGVEVDDDRLGYETILELEAREAFVDKEHTLDYFSEVIYPPTFNRNTRQQWQEQGSSDMLENARSIYQTIIKNHQPVAHSQEVLRELDAIAARADREMGK